MDEYTKDICDDLREEMEAGKELPAVRRFVTCSFQGMRAVLGEIDRLQALANDYAHEASANALKLEGFQKRVTTMGYDDFDALAKVFYRNVNWLQAIMDALKRYRGCSLTKTEAEAFGDLTSAIEEPPRQ